MKVEEQVMGNVNKEIDVREIPPQDKHSKIFKAIEALQSEETLEIINDHDPKPLYYQLTAEFPNIYEWTYLEEGPRVWRVAIRKK